MKKAEVKFENITKKFNETTAVDNVSCKFEAGTLTTLLGPSGCGKTTLLNITAGFIRPTSGKITLNNKEINGPGVDRGMVFQQGALFEWLTVAENVNFGLRMKEEDAAQTQKKVDEWLPTATASKRKGFGTQRFWTRNQGFAKARACDCKSF